MMGVLSLNRWRKQQEAVNAQYRAARTAGRDARTAGRRVTDNPWNTAYAVSDEWARGWYEEDARLEENTQLRR